MESCFASITGLAWGERYQHEISVLVGANLYEIPRPEWMDDEVLSQASHILVGMLFYCTSSPYNHEELHHYNSLES